MTNGPTIGLKIAKEKKHRIFFALNPSKDVSKLIQDAQKTVQRGNAAKRVCAKNFHLTLCFIGFVEKTALDCLIDKSSHILSDSFNLRMNHF